MSSPLLAMSSELSAVTTELVSLPPATAADEQLHALPLPAFASDDEQQEEPQQDASADIAQADVTQAAGTDADPALEPAPAPAPASALASAPVAPAPAAPASSAFASLFACPLRCPVRMGVSQETQKAILTVFMMLNAFVTPSGMIYGWPGLYQQLKDSGEFSSGCDDYDPKKTCPSQDTHLATIFTVGANVATLATVFYGFTLDRFGVRANACSGAFMMAAGFVLLAFSSSAHFNAFIPGFGLIAFGGLGTYLPAFQFSVLYSRPTLILSLQSALFGAAGLLFTFFKFLSEERGIPRETSFLWFAGLVAFCGLDMLLLYPAKPYHAGDEIHLPVLGWLGLADPPTAHRLLDDDSDSGSGANGTVNHHGDVVVEVSKAQSADYSPMRDEDRSRSASQSQNILASASNSKLDVFPRDGSSSIAPLHKSSSATHGYGSDMDSSSLSPKVLSPATARGRLVDGLIPSSEHVAHLRRERLVRDLTPAEFTAVKNARTFREELFDPGTILVALHFSIGLLCCNLYNANITTLLKDKGDSSGQIADAFVFITSIYPCAFSLLIDRIQKRWRYAGLSFLSTLCMIVGYAFLFIDDQYAQIPAFFIWSTGRALLITVMFSFVHFNYRGDHYGRVIAFVTTICAAIGLLQLLLQWILTGPANNEFDYFTAGMIAALTPLFYFSWWCYKNRV